VEGTQSHDVMAARLDHAVMQKDAGRRAVHAEVEVEDEQAPVVELRDVDAHDAAIAHRGRPLHDRLSERHGLVGRGGVRIDPVAVVAAVGAADLLGAPEVSQPAVRPDRIVEAQVLADLQILLQHDLAARAEERDRPSQILRLPADAHVQSAAGGFVGDSLHDERKIAEQPAVPAQVSGSGQPAPGQVRCRHELRHVRLVVQERQQLGGREATALRQLVGSMQVLERHAVAAAA
jgi:hypothetical protein